jgi:lipopolysaccharide export system protein LptA
MPALSALTARRRRLGALALAIALAASMASAEKADRNKPLNVEADSGRYDDLKQVGTFTGNVVVTKGTLTMRAERIEVRQSADGYQHGLATALPGQLATFSQKRDGVDETIQGEAERIEYDGRNDTVRFVNRAVIRRYRGGTLADETAGSVIMYDNLREVFSVVGGGASSATPANPGGRVRATLAPRDAGATPAASAPAATDLKPSATLGDAPPAGERR